MSRVDQLEIENALLRIKDIQRDLDKLKAEFTALMQGLQKPGYLISQGQDGKLIYVPVEKPPASTEPTKK